MRLAVIGSRGLCEVSLERYLPKEVDEIVSGGAKGVDAIAKAFALEHGLRYTEFLPQYAIYGRAAPIKRNEQIAAYADGVLAFWDGSSRGTMRTVALFERCGKPTTVILETKKGGTQ